MLLFALYACTGKPDATPVDTDVEAPIVDADEDGWSPPEDCDDAAERTNPGADDVPYDGVDQDCSGADLVDVDGDGYVGVGAGGDDCHDGNPTINPGAEEICYNDFDDDCDGVFNTSFDCDDDGFQQGQDCDDEDAAINPDAEDTWYDGVDQNCDNADDFDQDGDGEARSEEGGPDCDDLDPLVNTEGEESWDGRDEDCEGTVDVLTNRTETASWRGDHSLSELLFGSAITTVPDRNGDGTRDIVVGASGTAASSGKLYVLPATEGSGFPDEDQLGSVNGALTGDLGASLLSVNLDGTELVLAGAPGTTLLGEGGVVYAFALDAIGIGAVEGSAVATISFPWAGGSLSEWRAADGAQSVLVGAAYVAETSTSVALFPLAASGARGLRDASWALELPEETLDTSVVGDFDGDGLGEVAIAAFDAGDIGVVHVVTGEMLEAGDAETFTSITSLAGGSLVGPAPDFDGDGYDDLLVSDIGAERAVGRIWVIGGPDALETQRATDGAYATITGDLAGGSLRAARGHTDLDGDGKADLMTCAPGDGASGVDARCRFVSGSLLTGDVAPGAATPSFASESANDRFGTELLLEDVDADGDPDAYVTTLGDAGSLLFYRQD